MRLRLTAFTVLLILVTTGVVGTISVSTVWNVGYQRTIDHLESLSRLKHADLLHLGDDLLVDLRLISSEPVVNGLMGEISNQSTPKHRQLAIQEQLNTRFRQIVAKSLRIDEIFLINPAGYVAASSDVVNQPLFRRHERYFTHISVERRDFTLYVQDHVYSATAEQLNAVIAAIPIQPHSSSSQPHVLAVRTSSESLNDIMLEHSGLGDTGETTLVSSNQSLITDSRFPGYDSATTFLASEPIAATLKDRSPRSGTFSDYRGRTVIAAYTYLPSFQAVLVAKQDLNEAMEPVYQLIWHSILVMIPATLLAIGVAIIIARSTTAPLLGLEQATAAISHGDYSVPIPIERGDEIGNLAGHFDRMRQYIRSQIDELADINQELREEIAQRHQVEANLREAQKLEAIGRVTGGVAHDFNNMLSIISGFAEMSLYKVKGEQPLDGWLREITAAVKRSSTMTGQLLAYSQRQSLKPSTIDLGELIRDHVRPIQELVGTEITFTAQTPASPAWTLLDGDQFSRVLINLATNARDAMNGHGTLAMTLTVSASTASLEVVDSGPGIPDEIKSTLFEPFVTTKGVGHGTGLGLAMVGGIVKQSGGTITVTNEPSTPLPNRALPGAVFTITLPIAPTPHEQPTPEPSSETAITIAASDLHVLVVDDETASIRMLEQLFQDQGYEVTVTNSPAWALEHLERIQPNLLLTDINMPGMNGHQLAATAKKLIPDLRILLMSGAVDTDQHAHLHPMLAKPLQITSLTSAIAKLTDGLSSHQDSSSND